MSAIKYYVCDQCGSLERRDEVAEGEEWSCADCGSNRAWEFGNAAKAASHASHIQRGNSARIFRTAS